MLPANPSNPRSRTQPSRGSRANRPRGGPSTWPLGTGATRSGSPPTGGRSRRSTSPPSRWSARAPRPPRPGSRSPGCWPISSGWRPTPRSFDLVAVMFLHLPMGRATPGHAAAAEAVAPGGRLLVVGHDRSNLTEGLGGPQDPGSSSRRQRSPRSWSISRSRPPRMRRGDWGRECAQSTPWCSPDDPCPESVWVIPVGAGPAGLGHACPRGGRGRDAARPR